jgi:hypothetical protein
LSLPNILLQQDRECALGELRRIPQPVEKVGAEPKVTSNGAPEAPRSPKYGVFRARSGTEAGIEGVFQQAGVFSELPLYGVPRSSARPWLWGPRNESPLFETPLCMRDCFWATRVRGTIVPHPAKESILRDGRSGRRNRRRDHPPGIDTTARPGSQVPSMERKRRTEDP